MSFGDSLVLALSDRYAGFEIKSDASNVGIGAVLSQVYELIAHFCGICNMPHMRRISFDSGGSCERVACLYFCTSD